MHLLRKVVPSLCCDFIFHVIPIPFVPFSSNKYPIAFSTCSFNRFASSALIVHIYCRKIFTHFFSRVRFKIEFVLRWFFSIQIIFRCRFLSFNIHSTANFTFAAVYSSCALQFMIFNLVGSQCCKSLQRCQDFSVFRVVFTKYIHYYFAFLKNVHQKYG